MAFHGLTAELVTPAHLLAKLRHDFSRMRARPNGTYEAFDFFVTAEHMSDWTNTLSTRNSEPLLQIVSHIANGAKHFVATHPKHKSVRDISSSSGTFSSNAFDMDSFDPDSFDCGGIVVVLEEPHATLFGATVGALDLAERVLEYWTRRLSKVIP